VYTVSKEGLEWCRDYARKKELLVHFHLGETRKENEDFQKKTGKRPVPFLDETGLLDKNLVAAHCTWLTKAEVKLLGEREVKVSHCPVSNMKLATGGTMPFKEMLDSGVTVSLGTDGTASNNNLDLFEEMKFAALLQKAHRWDQTVLPASQAWQMATENGGKALGLKTGQIKEGFLADFILVDLHKPEMTPNHDLTSNLVYSAKGSCVTDVVCNGKVVMKDGKVKDEKTIIENAAQIAEKLVEERE
jgi:5-methylthioadenosine/S-adenosylhomocysteine deaminase